MKVTMYKNGMSRPAQPEDIERFTSAGWSLTASTVDAGAVKLRAPKKRAEVPTEKAEEAVEDLGNANEGE